MGFSSKVPWLKGVIGWPGWAECVALIPAMMLGWVWFGPLGTVVIIGAVVPVLLVATRRIRKSSGSSAQGRASAIASRDTIVETLNANSRIYDATGRGSACLIMCLDEPDRIAGEFGQGARDRAMQEIGTRLRGALRERDVLARLDATRFAVALEPMQRLDLEAAIQIAGRLKSAVEEPVSIDATTAYFSVSVGFCLSSRAPEPTGQSVLNSAETALAEARRNGPSAIRAYTRDMGQAADDREALRNEVETALERGDILAFFQPQLSTDTGEIAGFEALVRWQHPVRGLLNPAEFLPAVLACGLGRRLSEAMLHQALTALRNWDRAGFVVPSVGINFSREELSDPNLVATIKWELDRFELAPGRLNIEILESVIATSDEDIVVRNIAELSKLGCGIDLDDFGTGHASISSIRRFAVDRLKIDRSYVTRVDSDQSQQQLVGAILSMAERLGLTTLAEGIETIGEHAHLAQLGCAFVQGFAISRPLPFSATIEWMHKHRTKLTASAGLSQKRTG
ncbi:MAG: GGDEF domain-containing protein [Rhodobacteraceae bacterium]|nr:GGDEF domain-containing protein [Paracoccaceae bacterium]